MLSQKDWGFIIAHIKLTIEFRTENLVIYKNQRHEKKLYERSHSCTDAWVNKSQYK